ncbi:hypothetical protein TVAG_014860 [Trichomonas vaginalis G3]|uniref:Uncharacterized protein n=1 Tax=Trichomonas vaginalis (strain ATCC PRA-98 / G3) TaxID=412133 RepID=A2FG56_TRIV3|nr:hypothetical protein TVAGG3_0852100 [Trichomonas vaginalis G3]EAX96095.1 hypothetical protein TVAG_014860 [Trichomonas vaginalis G3]KAI5500067.1 hypothetical protein TVAGG3_0852100 [Trichomonas vaginalis G3]|eukprot:XP_001309025.1 hypothetical protein [Trichomonas vaginalis G3]
MAEETICGYPVSLLKPWERKGNIPKLCFFITNKEIVDEIKKKFALINYSEVYAVKKASFYHQYIKDRIPFMISYKKGDVITVVAATFVYGKRIYDYKGEVFVKFHITTDLPFLEVLDRLTGYSNQNLDLNQIQFEEPCPLKNEERLRNTFYDCPPLAYLRLFELKIHPDKDTTIFLICTKFNVEHCRLSTLCLQYNSDDSNPDYIKLDLYDQYRVDLEKKE